MIPLTLLTISSDEYWPVLELTAPGKAEYCLRHRIQYSMRRIPLNEPGYVHGNRMMRETLGLCGDGGWMFFMGADAMIMNHTIDARQFVSEDFDLVISNDVNGLNNDVFFLRNNDAGHHFLKRVDGMFGRVATDQEAMTIAMKDLRVIVVPQRRFNSYLYSAYSHIADDKGGSFQHGDFVLHLPGMVNDRRIGIFKEYIGRVVR